MPRVIGLPATLKVWGVPVELTSGYSTRGSDAFSPRGAVSHWTAGPMTGDRPSLNLCIKGRKDLPGPLCNVFLTRGGVGVVVAAGRANHAGSGGWQGLSGNSSVFGTEAENSGRGEWTAEQRRTYPRINAAYAMLGGFDAGAVCGHNEWAPSRKIDIRDYTMARMREEVAALLLEGPRGLSESDTVKLQRVVGGTPDGLWGERTTTAIQRWLGQEADGVFGPGSLSALQTKLGMKPTGQWPGSGTIQALSNYVNGRPISSSGNNTSANSGGSGGTMSMDEKVAREGIEELWPSAVGSTTSLRNVIAWFDAHMLTLRKLFTDVSSQISNLQAQVAELKNAPAQSVTDVNFDEAVAKAVQQINEAFPDQITYRRS